MSASQMSCLGPRETGLPSDSALILACSRIIKIGSNEAGTKDANAMPAQMIDLRENFISNKDTLMARA